MKKTQIGRVREVQSQGSLSPQLSHTAHGRYSVLQAEKAGKVALRREELEPLSAFQELCSPSSFCFLACFVVRALPNGRARGRWAGEVTVGEVEEWNGIIRLALVHYHVSVK